MMPRLFITALTISVPFSLFQFNAYLKGSAPSLTQVLCSTLFVVLWLGSSLIAGYIMKPSFIKAATAYWCLGLSIVLLGYWTEASLLNIPGVLLYCGPLYSLTAIWYPRTDLLSASYTILVLQVLIAMSYGAGLLWHRMRSN